MTIQSITLITGMSKKLHILIIPSWYPDDKDDFRGSTTVIVVCGANISVSTLATVLVS